MIFYSDLYIHNANNQPALVHSDMVSLYAYHDEMYYVNDSQVHHKILTDKDLANPLAFSGGLVQFNYNSTNLKLDSSTNALNTIQDISTSSIPLFRGLNILNTTSAAGAFFATSTNDTVGSILALTKVREAGYPLSGDSIGTIRWQSISNNIGVSITVKAAQNWSSSNLGSTLGIYTCAIGSNTLVERLSITSTGAITFNNAYTFPITDGASTQVLATNGSGSLSWTTSTNTDEKVKIKSGGTAAYLLDKLIAGTNINIAEGSGANADKIVITADGGGSKWSLLAHSLDNYMTPTPPTYPQNIFIFHSSSTTHPKYSCERQGASYTNIQNNYILGEFEFIGQFNSTIQVLSRFYSRFNIISDEKYSTFFFANSYFDGSNNKYQFTCLELNHEKALFASATITLADQTIQRASSNIFYLPSNAQASNKIYFATSATQAGWKTISEVLTSSLGTPTEGSVIYHDGTTWVAYHPSTSPSNLDVLTWAGSPRWSTKASSDFEKFKDINTIDDIYYLELSDAGKLILSDDSTEHRVYIPTNSSVAFPLGTVIFIATQTDFNLQVIATSGVTFIYKDIDYLEPKTLAILSKIDTDTWMLSKLT